MTYAQAYRFFKDKRDTDCPFTKELIENGFCQRSNGYIAVAIVSGLNTPPSQWWHLMQYCLGKYEKKQENQSFHYTPCGELVFWMAEVSGALSKSALDGLKLEILDMDLLNRKEINHKIKNLCWDAIIRKVENEATE